MAFELPVLPFPRDANETPHISVPDDNTYRTVPSSQYFKKLIGDKYLWTPVSDADPLPTSDDVLRNKDFATQATLEQILAKIIENPATDTNQEAIKTVLATLLTQSGFDAKADITLSALRDALTGAGVDAKTLNDLATLIGEVQAAPTANTLLARLKSLEDKIDAITSGATPATAQLTGSYATIDSAPVVGVKTVSTTAAELFAGVSRFANRYAMIVYNESSIPVYWGPAGVTTTTGFTLLPQDSVVFQFNPSVATAIYFIAGSNAAVRVVELA